MTNSRQQQQNKLTNQIDFSILSVHNDFPLSIFHAILCFTSECVDVVLVNTVDYYYTPALGLLQ